MRRISINQPQFTSHAALRPMEFAVIVVVTTLDNEEDVVNFEKGQTQYFDGEEFARSGRLVPADGPGEPTGMVTITSVDRVSRTVEFGSDEWMQRELDADAEWAREHAGKRQQ